MTAHLEAKKDEIAPIVLLAGDPLRAKYMAEKYLTNIIQYNQVRNMFGFTGYYKDQRISIQGSGMGMASFGIYATELIQVYGVHTLVRVGSCGSIQENIDLQDLVLAQASSSDSYLGEDFTGIKQYSAIADFDLLYKAYTIAPQYLKSHKLHVGNVYSSDIFYDPKERWKQHKNYNVLAIEMETTMLYILAAIHKIRALCILTVSDSLITHKELSSSDRQTSFHTMIEVALNTVIAK